MTLISIPQVWWYPFNRAVGEEPLRLMAHIAANDYPWSAIVTADYTMANPLLGDIFPVEYPTNGRGWLPPNTMMAALRLVSWPQMAFGGGIQPIH